MPTTHPIDAALRRHLRDLTPHQQSLAKRIGRSQGWLNKYLNGAGKATIDDLIRIVAIVLLGVESPPVTAEERKLLRDWATLPPKGRAAVKAVFAIWHTRRRERRSQSNGRAAQKNHQSSGRGPGTR